MARPLWKGAISFGLVTIPVSLFSAKEARENLAFHMLHRTNMSRVHNRRVDEEGHEVPYEEIVKGYEYEKNRYVVVEDADMRAANVEATQTIDIMHFVDGDEIDICYYDTPYYTEPDKTARKAYALLRETLKRARRVGVARIVMRERQHLCLVVPDRTALLAYTLRWPYQLRDMSDFDLPGEDLEDLGVSPQELNMAEQLVEIMFTAWDPGQYHDTYHDDLLKLIQEKIATGKVTEPPEPLPKAEPAGDVVDIMALLKRSVEQREAGRKAAGDAGSRTLARRRKAGGAE